jgi:hypothetical protein
MISTATIGTKWLGWSCKRASALSVAAHLVFAQPDLIRVLLARCVLHSDRCSVTGFLACEGGEQVGFACDGLRAELDDDLARPKPSSLRRAMFGRPRDQYSQTPVTFALSRIKNSLRLSLICTAATFSSRCVTVDVPGIGSITGERCSSQASSSWASVAL